MNRNAEVAVIGGGVLGLAHALVAAREGRSVVLFERHPEARGASVRNFGMIWPISHPLGELRDRALRGREVWLDVARETGIWHDACGSLHLAYWPEELEVLEEFHASASSAEFPTTMLRPAEVRELSPGIRAEGLLGALRSPAELCVDPREAIAAIPRWLHEKHGVVLRFGTQVHSIDAPHVETADERWHVERVVVCSGDDFETLYPEVFRDAGVTRCKLQMMRTAPQPGDWAMGPMLADGVSFAGYGSFRSCTSLTRLRERIELERAEELRWGIQAKVSQNGRGEITIGDSHELGISVSDVRSAAIDRSILDGLRRFLTVPDLEIAERWQGVYVKHSERTDLVVAPCDEVRVVSVCSGSGMTLGFGLAEEVWAGW
jgi:FAD dependent oxidoreductase TIGR03364